MPIKKQLTTGQTVCLLLRVTVPQGVSNGASSNTTILAVMDYNNTSPVIQQSLSRTDLVTVSDEESHEKILTVNDLFTKDEIKVFGVTFTSYDGDVLAIALFNSYFI